MSNPDKVGADFLQLKFCLPKRLFESAAALNNLVVLLIFFNYNLTSYASVFAVLQVLISMTKHYSKVGYMTLKVSVEKNSERSGWHYTERLNEYNFILLYKETHLGQILNINSW